MGGTIMNNIEELGNLLIATMDEAVKGNKGSSDELIRRCDKTANDTIKALGDTRDEEAVPYLLAAYRHKFPNALFFPNGAGAIANPCWINVELDKMLRCNINRVLGKIGGELAYHHLIIECGRGFGIGQGMSSGCWYPSSAIEGLEILGDIRAIPIIEKRIGAPFISEDAKNAIRIIKERNQQKLQLEKSNRVKIWGTWVTLEPFEKHEYDDYEVTKFIDYVFISGKYQTIRERTKESEKFIREWGWTRPELQEIKDKKVKIVHHYPEDKIRAKIKKFSEADINIVRKYIEANKGIYYKLGFGRLHEIEDELNEILVVEKVVK
jgi:hypothetical protein